MGKLSENQARLQTYIWKDQMKALEKIIDNDKEGWNWKGERPTLSKHIRRALDLYFESLPPAFRRQIGLKLEKNRSF